jgi:hypothetical protein
VLRAIGEIRRVENEVGLQPERALLRAEYPFTQGWTITVGGGPAYRSQGLAASVGTIVNSTEVLRFSDQAESSVSDPAASRHSDVVLRAALPAAEVRAHVDTGVLTARTDAAEAHGLTQRAPHVARAAPVVLAANAP